MLTQTSVHKGRWGWYPTSFQTYLKLKELNKQVLREKRQLATWERWNRKDPQNRVIRPKLRRDGQVVGYGAPVPRPEPPVDDKIPSRYVADCIEVDYANVRHPQPSESDVRLLKLSEEEIDRLYQKLK